MTVVPKTAEESNTTGSDNWKSSWEKCKFTPILLLFFVRCCFLSSCNAAFVCRIYLWQCRCGNNGKISSSVNCCGHGFSLSATAHEVEFAAKR